MIKTKDNMLMRGFILVTILATAKSAEAEITMEAAFQGHCGHTSPCEQLCYEIHDGMYECDCIEGYELNKNGYSCQVINSTGSGDGHSKSDEDVLYQKGASFSAKLAQDNSDDNHLTSGYMGPSSSLKSSLGSASASLSLESGEEEDDLNDDSNYINDDIDSLPQRPNDFYISNESSGSMDTNYYNGNTAALERDTSSEQLFQHKQRLVSMTTAKPLNLLLHRYRQLSTATTTSTTETTMTITTNTNTNTTASMSTTTPAAAATTRKITTEQQQGVEEEEEEEEQDLVNDYYGKQDQCGLEGLCDNTDGSSRCLCPFGKTGNNCNEDLKVRVPKFSKHSWLAFPALRGAYKHVQLRIEFRPESFDGIILLSGERDDLTGDFMALLLNKGFVEFWFDCGSGAGSVRSRETILLNEWNSVIIYRHRWDAWLVLNHGTKVQGRSNGLFSRITFREPVFLGGTGNITGLANRLPLTTGYLGCIRRFVANEHDYKFEEHPLGDVTKGFDIQDCITDKCFKYPCQHGGKCLPSDQGAICLCPIGFVGDLCEIRMDLQVPAFNGSSFLRYAPLDDSALIWLELKVILKPELADGLVLYSGPKHHGDFVALALNNGFVEFTFDLGSGPAVVRSQYPLIIGQWHTIKVSRTARLAVLKIDQLPEVMTISSNGFWHLSLPENLFVGGVNHVDKLPMDLKNKPFFMGCIQRIEINGHSLAIVSEALGGSNIGNCPHACVARPCGPLAECVPQMESYECRCSVYNAQCNKEAEVSIEELQKNKALTMMAKSSSRKGAAVGGGIAIPQHNDLDVRNSYNGYKQQLQMQQHQKAGLSHRKFKKQQHMIWHKQQQQKPKLTTNKTTTTTTTEASPPPPTATTETKSLTTSEPTTINWQRFKNVQHHHQSSIEFDEIAPELLEQIIDKVNTDAKYDNDEKEENGDDDNDNGDGDNNDNNSDCDGIDSSVNENSKAIATIYIDDELHDEPTDADVDDEEEDEDDDLDEIEDDIIFRDIKAMHEQQQQAEEIRQQKLLTQQQPPTQVSLKQQRKRNKRKHNTPPKASMTTTTRAPRTTTSTTKTITTAPDAVSATRIVNKKYVHHSHQRLNNYKPDPHHKAPIQEKPLHKLSRLPTHYESFQTQTGSDILTFDDPDALVEQWQDLERSSRERLKEQALHLETSKSEDDEDYDMAPDSDSPTPANIDNEETETFVMDERLFDTNDGTEDYQRKQLAQDMKRIMANTKGPYKPKQPKLIITEYDYSEEHELNQHQQQTQQDDNEEKSNDSTEKFNDIPKKQTVLASDSTQTHTDWSLLGKFDLPSSENHHLIGVRKNFGACFAGQDSYFHYNDAETMSQIISYNIDLNLRIKTRSENGVILWTGRVGSSDRDSDDYLSLGIEDGYLHFRYNLGSGEVNIRFNATKVSDGLWHRVRAIRDSQEGYLEVDGRKSPSSRSPGKLRQLNTDTGLYVGGMPDASYFTRRRYTSGIVGCISEIVLAGELKMNFDPNTLGTAHNVETGLL
ncbi:hypothetical protein DOY81_000373 [Sarcophaga bullata]|nr:hypothetical protein DOY81_000373 [Sarcophaga bullata]